MHLENYMVEVKSNFILSCQLSIDRFNYYSVSDKLLRSYN